MPGGARETDSETIDRLRPYIERARAFVGWNLDRVSPKQIGPRLPWDYKRRAQELLAGAWNALDLGTGGGELFAELCKAYRGRAVASEPWAVNAPIAKRALSHLRIEVVRAHSLHLPFRNGAFDLVLDRHEEMDPSEVHRVLAPGGTVFTQRVGRTATVLPPHAGLRPAPRSICAGIPASRNDCRSSRNARHARGVPRT